MPEPVKSVLDEPSHAAETEMQKQEIIIANARTKTRDFFMMKFPFIFNCKTIILFFPIIIKSQEQKAPAETASAVLWWGMVDSDHRSQ